MKIILSEIFFKLLIEVMIFMRIAIIAVFLFVTLSSPLIFQPREEWIICGIASTSRIVGGEDADPGQFSWTAALMTKDNSRNFCGGAVIFNQFILTTAQLLLTSIEIH